MYEYKIGDLALMLGGLNKTARDLSTSDQLQQSIADDEYIRQLAILVDGLAILCKNFDADPSLIEMIETLRDDLKSPTLDRRECVLFVRARAVEAAIQNNLNSRKFMFIPADQASYWDDCDIFGKNFIASFPDKACIEMIEAGRCFAVARGTACVFHCMRVAEYGLRKLAKQLRVDITDHGKPCPIEYGTWSKIITAVRNKLDDLRKQAASKRKEELIQRYSSIADQCEYLKDIWRNELAHTRRFYNKAETLGVINRVRDFIRPFLLGDKDAAKEIDKKAKRIQRLQGINGPSFGGPPQRNKIQTTSGTGSEKTKPN